MTEVILTIDSQDRERTVASLTAALQTLFHLPPEETRAGVEMAFDAHSKALEVLMDHTHPDQVGVPASVAAMFAWSQISESHVKSSNENLHKCLTAASLLSRVEAMIGDK